MVKINIVAVKIVLVGRMISENRLKEHHGESVY